MCRCLVCCCKVIIKHTLGLKLGTFTEGWPIYLMFIEKVNIRNVGQNTLTKMLTNVIISIQKYEQFDWVDRSEYLPYMGQSIEEWTKEKFLKAVFHKFYLVHSWILGLICFLGEDIKYLN